MLQIIIIPGQEGWTWLIIALLLAGAALPLIMQASHRCTHYSENLCEKRQCALAGKAKDGAAAAADAGGEGFKEIARMKGSELKGLRYEPLFQYFVPEYKGTAWRVCADTYVTDDSGTGVVHQAPAFGEDDYRCAHPVRTSLCTPMYVHIVVHNL